MAPNPMMSCFAVTSPGLEPLVEREVRALGVRSVRRDRGGVSFRATTRQLYAANAWLRVASRVLVRVGEPFRARTWDQLIDGFAALDLGPFVGAGATFRVSSTRSRLYHTGAIAERLDSSVGGPGPTELVVRVVGDRVTVSADASGHGLHRRGWRLAVGKAPLRETLAAAMVATAGWDGTVALVDPFCGSGTVPIEAVLAARGLPPGAERRFAFADWPGFEAGTWASVQGAMRAASATAASRRTSAVLGSDRDRGAILAAAANAQRAGVGADVDFVERAVSDGAPPPSAAGAAGWVLSNPPYGSRLGGGDLRNLYARFGQVLRRSFPGWQVGLLVADPGLARHTGLDLEERFSTSNGGLGVRFLTGRVPG